MISVSVKKLHESGNIAVSRGMGATGGAFKVLRKKYGVRRQYSINERNRIPLEYDNVVFPDDDYSALDFTPVRQGCKFLGWSDEEISDSMFSQPQSSEVEYIESDGNQYIDIGMAPTDASKFGYDIRFSLTSVNSTNRALFGCRSVRGVGPTSYSVVVYGQQMKIDASNTDWAVDPAVGTIHELLYRPTETTIDGVSKTNSTKSACKYNFRLFDVNQAGSSPSGYSKALMRLYSFKVYDGSTIVMDCIPVRIGTNGYLFDKISESILRTGGTGNFSCGADTTSQIDYILPEDQYQYDVSSVNAVWQKPIQIIFDATTNGGTMPQDWEAPDYFLGSTYGRLPEPTKSGSFFIGWYDSSGNRITKTSTIDQVYLIAKFVEDVTFPTTWEVQTTDEYRKTGIFSVTRKSGSKPIIVDWGDGELDVVKSGSISKLVHTYQSSGTFTVRLDNHKDGFSLSINSSSWYDTESQNKYTVKRILTVSSEAYYTAYAFNHCEALEYAILPSGTMTSIFNDAFANCSSLHSEGIVFPSTLTRIGNRAFQGCNSENFRHLDIPGTITGIGVGAFRYCSYLDLTFESSNSTLSLDQYSFSEMGNGLTSGWTIDLSPRTITVIPDYCFLLCTYITAITFPTGLTAINTQAFQHCFRYHPSQVEIPEGVTIIGNAAFRNCSELYKVTIPSTCTTINNQAFSECKKLDAIVSNALTAPTVYDATFGSGTSTFTGYEYHTQGLNRLFVPANATGYDSSYWADPLQQSGKCNFILYQGDCDLHYIVETTSSYKKTGIYSAIRHDSNEPVIVDWGDGTSDTISGNISQLTHEYSSVGRFAVLVKNISSFALSANNQTWYQTTSQNQYTLKRVVSMSSSITKIEKYAFNICTNLTSITIPDSVTRIGYAAFYSCTNLTSINIPSSVTSIGDRVFYGLINLTSITIPDSVTSIGDEAFRDCSGLTSVTIPDSVTSIGDWAFAECTNLTSITVDLLNPVYDSRNNCNAIIHTADNTLVLGFKGTEIPDDVTSIGNYAFSLCRGLTSINIPSSVTSIGYQAFLGCTNLTSITIPNSVTSIGNYAFSRCSNLTSINIPSSVTSIGYQAFESCIRLTTITCNASTAPTVKSGTFGNGTSNYVGRNSYSSGSNRLIIPANATGYDSSYWADPLCDNTKCGFTVVQDATTFTVETTTTYKKTGIYSATRNDATKPVTINWGDGTVQTVDGNVSQLTHAYSSVGEFVVSVENITDIALSTSTSTWGNTYNNYIVKKVSLSSEINRIRSNAFSSLKGIVSFVVDENNPNYSSVNGLLLSKDGKTLIVGVNGDVVIPNTVTTIRRSAFYELINLTSINIPNSVTSIGNYAFYCCSGLMSVTIPDSVTSIGAVAFCDCRGLTSVTIPNSVTSIGEQAFIYCRGLTSITIPNSVTSIGSHAFRYCNNLEIVTIGSGMTSDPNRSFLDCPKLKEFIVDENNQTYSSSNGLLLSKNGTTLVCAVNGYEKIPDSVTTIGEYAYSCVNLTSITIPKNITTIGDYAFADSSKLRIVKIPDSVTTIGKYAFYNCTNLTSITIPNSVTSIGEYAFYNCSGLTSVNISDLAAWCNISFGSSVANPCYYADHLFLNGMEITDLTIPDSVRGIAPYAFFGCTSLTSINIPNSVTSIWQYSFACCTNLSTIICNALVAPQVTTSTFGNGTLNYTGRNTYNTGVNKLIVPTGATGYTASSWSSVLLDASKCGFTLVQQ